MHATLSRLTPLLFASPRVRQLHASLGNAEQGKLITGFRQRVAECNREGPPSLPFLVGDTLAGRVSATIVPALAEHPAVFEVSDDTVRLAAPLVSAPLEERTAAVATVTSAMKEAGLVNGWRDELLAVTTAFDAPPVLLLERACVPMFGTGGYGVHVNGYCREPETGEGYLWVATRAASKQTWPSMLDHMVAGAQPAGLSPSENVIKEAGEEAGVPPELAATARSVGCVNYCGTDEWDQLRRDTLFCYDMELPWDFVPTAVDGEVDSFERWPYAKVARAVAFADPAAYKPNCNLVVIDFLVRQGFITADAPGYLQLLGSLRTPECR